MSGGEPLVVLLVEDNPDHTELMRRSFEAHSIANMIRHVLDGEAALNYLFRRNEYADPINSPRPHLVLLDLRLPKVGGLEVLRQIKTSADLWSIPVVIVTTSVEDRDLANDYVHRANSYVVKPFDFNKFTRLINELGLKRK